ncbi:CsgG/HfaB family protein, partial [Gemmatimonadota bacterium]
MYRLYYSILVGLICIPPSLTYGHESPYYEGKISSSVFTQQESQLIAVIELDALGVSQEEAQAITERLRARLSEYAVFDVIERNKMESILIEQGFQISGTCDTDSCVVQIGMLLGAKRMVAGSVSHLGTIYSLQIRIVDVQSGRIESVADTDEYTIEDLLIKGCSTVSRELAIYTSRSQGFDQPLITSATDNLNRRTLFYRVNIGSGLFLQRPEYLNRLPGSHLEFAIGGDLSNRFLGIFSIAYDSWEGGLYKSYAPAVGALLKGPRGFGYFGAS